MASRASIQHQLLNREANWLAAIRTGIFSSPEHPYSQMFRLAGCSYGDLAEAVVRDGLEATLHRLQRAGVYLTHGEFKGTEPIVRSGHHIASDRVSFTNPLVSGWFEASSGQSRSTGTKTRSSTAHLLHFESYFSLGIQEFGLAGRPFVPLRSILPGGAGVFLSLVYARLGCRVDRWFAVGSPWHNSAHYRALTNYFMALARLHGLKVAFPEHLPPNDYSPVAAWLAERRRRGIFCTVQTVASSAVRVSTAALEKGWDISGTIFFSGGEPLTEAKRRRIEAAGAEVFPTYWVSEAGPIGFACRRMNTGNCVHLFRDSVAVINHRRRAPLSDAEVDSLLITTLLPCAPHLLINAEMDDCGIVQKRDCDCLYAQVGLTEQVSDISSFGKMTGQGMTLVGTDIVRILEDALPAAFGGAPGDYQMVEHDADAQTELVLRVSPRVPRVSREQVKDVFLRELSRCYGGSQASRVWRHSDALKIVWAEPLVTPGGKIHPLHLLERQIHGFDASQAGSSYH